MACHPFGCRVVQRELEHCTQQQVLVHNSDTSVNIGVPGTGTGHWYWYCPCYWHWTLILESMHVTQQMWVSYISRNFTTKLCQYWFGGFF